MKKLSKMMIVIMSITLVMSGCGQDDDLPEPVVATTPATGTGTGTGGTTTSYPSPCTSTLTGNQMSTTTNMFPIGSPVTITTALSNDLTQVNGTVVATFPGGGDVDVKLGGVIAAGTYNLVDNPFPSAGEALLIFIPISGNNYKSTSGTLYITETSTQWILEWCSINCNSLAGSTIISTSSTGSFVVNK